MYDLVLELLLGEAAGFGGSGGRRGEAFDCLPEGESEGGGGGGGFF